MMQTQLEEAFRRSVDQRFDPKPLHEAIQFPDGKRALGEIDEMCSNATLREETKGLTRIGALLDSEYLHFHVAFGWKASSDCGARV